MMLSAGWSRTSHSDSGRSSLTLVPPRSTHRVLPQTRRPRYRSRSTISRTAPWAQPRLPAMHGTPSAFSRLAIRQKPHPLCDLLKDPADESGLLRDNVTLHMVPFAARAKDLSIAVAVDLAAGDMAAAGLPAKRLTGTRPGKLALHLGDEVEGVQLELFQRRIEGDLAPVGVGEGT